MFCRRIEMRSTCLNNWALLFETWIVRIKTIHDQVVIFLFQSTNLSIATWASPRFWNINQQSKIRSFHRDWVRQMVVLNGGSGILMATILFSKKTNQTKKPTKNKTKKVCVMTLKSTTNFLSIFYPSILFFLWDCLLLLQRDSLPWRETAGSPYSCFLSHRASLLLHLCTCHIFKNFIYFQQTEMINCSLFTVLLAVLSIAALQITPALSDLKQQLMFSQTVSVGKVFEIG